MASSKFESVWRLLSKYIFNVDPDSRSDNLICIICSRLMRDAYQSGCGCQYCYDCIVQYLHGGSRCCPGGKEECEEEYLKLNENVTRNIRMNNSICKMKVKCPNESCRAFKELSSMEDHLRVCVKQLSQCPYASIGCEAREGPKDQIHSHVHSETFVHSELLVDWIQNLRNEVYEMKDQLERSRNEMTQLREESTLKEEQMVSLMSITEAQSREIEIIKSQVNEKDDNIMRLNEEVREMKNKLKVQKEMKRQCSDVDLSVVEGACGYNYSDDKFGRKKRSSTSSNSNFDFLWRISNWGWNLRNMPVKGLYSESFYSHDYRFCLCLYIYENIIQLYCYIMKGDEDHRLQWPMKRAITLSIINQDTLAPYTSVTFQYDTYNNKNAFGRPKDDMNEYIGIWPFVHYNAIKDVPFIIVNDSLVVTCVLGELWPNN